MAYYILQERCTCCRRCFDVCINGAIIDLTEQIHINPAWCTECGSCEAMCYEDAIVYKGLEERMPEVYQGESMDFILHNSENPVSEMILF
jgi:MinD superfamily P-loop ATPase